MTWTMLSAMYIAGRPSARHSHGFTSAGGLLYVHGGWPDSGNAISLPLGPGSGSHEREKQDGTESGSSRIRRVPSRSAPVRLSVQSVRRLEPRTRLLPRLLVRRMPCPVKFDHRRI
jgi:hypothetical protein